jgi:hypothetical protein
MQRVARCLTVVTGVVTGLALFGHAAPARAGATADAEEESAPARARAAVADPDAAAGAVAADATLRGSGLGEAPPDEITYGLALRLRYVSVPSWMLGLFTKHNVPLGTLGHYGIEGFRRHGNFDLVLAISYQNMSPPDGNWLGADNPIATQTNYVQFHGLSLISADIAFIWHTRFNDWAGIHYGAGFGVGIVRGSLTRNLSDNCTEQNIGDLTQCHPAGAVCTSGSCATATLPNQKADPEVPPAVPIVNIVVGADFRVPTIKGWEAKIEGGFYDAFFLGGAVGYTF